MTNDDHNYLLNELVNIKGKVVLSGYDNDLYNNVLLGWRKVNTALLGDGRKMCNEVLWLKDNLRFCRILPIQQNNEYTIQT